MADQSLLFEGSVKLVSYFLDEMWRELPTDYKEELEKTIAERTSLDLEVTY